MWGSRIKTQVIRLVRQAHATLNHLTGPLPYLLKQALLLTLGAHWLARWASQGLWEPCLLFLSIGIAGVQRHGWPLHWCCGSSAADLRLGPNACSALVRLSHHPAQLRWLSFKQRHISYLMQSRCVLSGGYKEEKGAFKVFTVVFFLFWHNYKVGNKMCLPNCWKMKSLYN